MGYGGVRLASCLGAVALTAAVAGCGGGGAGGSGGSIDGAESQVLNVNVSYQGGGSFPIFEQSRFAPTVNGLEGRAPLCKLIGGHVPAGMQPNSDCSISGRPTVPGPYSFQVRVGAS